MAAGVASAGGGWSCSSGGVFVEVEEEGEFGEREVEVAAILAGLKFSLRGSLGGKRRWRPGPEIPSWGKRRRRTTPAAGEKLPVGLAAAPAAGDGGDSRGEGAASPDTPLAFPEERGDDDEDTEEEQREDEKKARAHEEEQRGVVASLSHENAHLLKQIEEFKARLQSSRSTNDSLKKIQSKHKKLPLPLPPQENEEEAAEEDGEDRKRRLHAAAGWPALGLDLNEPVAEPEPQPVVAAAAQWPRHHRDQLEQHKAALTAAARRRRQLIRRAKAAATRTRRLG